jgi:hypothetical protein
MSLHHSPVQTQAIAVDRPLPEYSSFINDSTTRPAFLFAKFAGWRTVLLMLVQPGPVSFVCFAACTRRRACSGILASFMSALESL